MQPTEWIDRSGAAAASLRGLYREYGDRLALRDVTLELPAGQTLAVLGPNGAGKTTLLRILATLLRPSGGGVEVLGAELPREAWRVRGRIGYLGHEPLLYRELTVRENLDFHARLHGLGERGGERAAELLGHVGMAHRCGERARNLSAGMLQRVAVCRAVLHEPELLLLDEPLANLDPEGAAAVEPLLAEAPAARVVVTHDYAAGIRDADRVLALRHDGSVAYEGSASGLSPGDAATLYDASGGRAQPSTPSPEAPRR